MNLTFKRPLHVLALFGLCTNCLAMMDIMEVSREQAKAWGVTIRTNLNGQAGVGVWMEFKPEGKFRQFRNVQLQIGEGQNRVMSATLVDSPLSTGNLSVSFSVQPAYLAESTLLLVVDDQPLGGSGYRFRVMDFIEQSRMGEKAIRRTAVDAVDAGDGWSLATNGLQVRLTLEEGARLNGTRWLVPHLELRNVRDLANQLEVLCDHRHLKVELVDAQGNPRHDEELMNRTGPVPDLGKVTLPYQSSMRISLECRNWGIPKDAPAMVSTDGGAWVLKASERGTVYLRATLTGEKIQSPYWEIWHGTVQTPLLKLDWR